MRMAILVDTEERKTFGKTLTVTVNGGEQVIIVDPPPRVARKLVISC